MSEPNGVIHPRLHHYGLTTANLKTMSKWYATVLGMSVVFETSSALGKDAPIKVGAAWAVSYTHLDVYKRQAGTSAFAAQKKDSNPPVCGGDGNCTTGLKTALDQQPPGT